MQHDTYESPLVSRNASPEMLRLFSPQHKFAFGGGFGWSWRGRSANWDSRITSEASRRCGKVDQIDFKRPAMGETPAARRDGTRPR